MSANNFIIIKGEKFTTPVARFRYPKLITPDFTYNPDGEYKVQPMIEAAEGQDLVDKLDNLLARHKESLKSQAPTQKFKLADLPWSFETFDGLACVSLKSKMKAGGIDRDGKPWSRKPALFDAKGKPVTDREALSGMWTGTVGRVSFMAMPFYSPAIGAGITLRLQAVQIISLVESGGDATSHGFEEEDGWTPSEESKQPQAEIPWDASPVAADEGDF